MKPNTASRSLRASLASLTAGCIGLILASPITVLAADVPGQAVNGPNPADSPRVTAITHGLRLPNSVTASVVAQDAVGLATATAPLLPPSPPAPPVVVTPALPPVNPDPPTAGIIPEWLIGDPVDPMGMRCDPRYVSHPLTGDPDPFANILWQNTVTLAMCGASWADLGLSDPVASGTTVVMTSTLPGGTGQARVICVDGVWHALTGVSFAIGDSAGAWCEPEAAII